jgi:hypothetical protein
VSKNPYLARQQAHPIGRAGRSSETRTSQRLGARQTAASGAASEKGDLRRERVLIEAKATEHNSITLPLDYFAKITREAQGAGCVPALSIAFVTGSGQPKPYGRWVALPEDVVKRLMEEGRL